MTRQHRTRRKVRTHRPSARRERLLIVLLGATIFWAIVVYALFVEL